MQQRFLLQILLLAQHVSGTTMHLFFNWPSVTHTKHATKQPVKQYPANRTHNPQLHTRPTTWKPQVCTSLHQTHATVQQFRIHTITPYKQDTWTTDRNHQAIHCKKPTTKSHTRPPRHSTHIITNLDNTRHLILRTQILSNLQITFYIFTARNNTGSNHRIILLSSWWWAQWCPKHVEQAIRSAIKTSVASSWHFITTY